MTPDQFFDEVDLLYKDAENISKAFKRKDIYRGRQHSISSVAEDLLAAYLYDNLRSIFPNIGLYFMVDYSIKPNNSGPLLMPDVAVIVEKKKAALASYIDLKTDLGYKRRYYERLPDLKSFIQRVSKSKWLGRKTYEGQPIVSAPNLVWRTVIVSDKNISKELLVTNKTEFRQYRDYFKAYFLSGNKHPNRKKRNLVHIYEDAFSELLSDIETDIRKAIPLISKN